MSIATIRDTLIVGPLRDKADEVCSAFEQYEWWEDAGYGILVASPMWRLAYEHFRGHHPFPIVKEYVCVQYEMEK